MREGSCIVALLGSGEEIAELAFKPDSTIAAPYSWGKKMVAQQKFFKMSASDFPGGAVVKNPPANAGDMGSSPGPGRSHMPRSN